MRFASYIFRNDNATSNSPQISPYTKLSMMNSQDTLVNDNGSPKCPDQGRETNKAILKHREEPFTTDIIGNYEHIPGMYQENTVWDVYNNEARKVDNELVKDWQSSLNFLLVFAAIFAAVLTAFIIESKKLLEQDQTALLVSVTVWNMNNAGNSSNLPYAPPDFKPTYEAVSINCLLFASLVASLVAALASVIALQWVADYDAAITRGGSSSEDRAKRRQFRFAGVMQWKMSEIIAALPLLLYSSVILFWAGLIQWMLSIHHAVGYVVAGGTFIAVSFYVSTTLLSALYVSSPFRTPLSRGLYWTLQAPIASIIMLISSFHIPQWVHTARRKFNSSDQHYIPWRLYWKIQEISHLFRRLFRLIRSTKSPAFVGRSVQWLKAYVLPNMTSRLREDKAAEDDATFEQQALIWLAYQLPISADSHRRLSLLFAEVANNPRATLASPGSVQDPWLAILEYFSTDCLRRVLSTKTDEGRFDDVGVLLRFIECLTAERKIQPSDYYETDPKYQRYWSQCCSTPETLGQMSESMTFLLARDIPIPSINSMEELIATTKLIRWRNKDEKLDVHLWMDILACPEIYSHEYLNSCRQIFAKFLSSLTTFGRWLHLPFSHEPEKRHEQIIGLVEVALLAMEKNTSGILHRNLIWSICDGMMAFGEGWPCPSPCADQIIQRVGNLQDPCLAIIARFACGISIFGNPTMTGPYKSKYIDSIQRVQKLFYRDLFPKNSAVIHEFRAAVFGIEFTNTDPYRTAVYGVTDTGASESCELALKEQKSLWDLQRIMEHSTYCHGSLQGDCHMLFHLYMHLPALCNLRPEVITSGRLRVPTNQGNPILLFLAMPSLDSLFYSLAQNEVDSICLTAIWDLCQGLKQHPSSVCALLTEILTSKSTCNPCDVALILESVLQMIAIWDSGDSDALLRPLASALARSPEKMRWWFQEDPYLKVVGLQAKDISGLLYTASASILISSASHLKILSCVKTNTSVQPAVGRLPMYISL